MRRTPEPAGVRYEHVGEDYLAQRTLRKGAGWILLWALGVGATISGDYFGWNYGLAVGGFYGMAAATLLVSVLFVCMVFSIAELSAALPHAGGFYSFTRSALGPTGGFVCGVTDTIEYVLSPAVIVDGIAGYLHALWPTVPAYVWWVGAYALFVAINVRGVELTLQVSLIVTTLAVAVLVAFFGGALVSGAFSTELLFNVAPSAGQSARGLPHGLAGVVAALPYATWFYLGIEQLPLAAEETYDVVRDMPRALRLGLATLLVLALATLVLNAGVGGGAEAIARSDAPLGEGFKAVFGAGATTWVLTLTALAGLVASFHSLLYAAGRVLFALSRAGYFPRVISLTNRHKTPHVALILSGGLGLGCVMLLDRFRGGAVGAALLNMAVFGAVISYVLVLVSFIKLRLGRPALPRPYRSPLGIAGAAVGVLLALLALVATFASPKLRPAVLGVAVFLALALLYFALYSRKRLVAQAPEEAAARGEEGGA